MRDRTRGLRRAACWIAKATCFVAALSSSAFVADAARAAQIDLRLDVAYSGGNPAAGGSWELYARSDGLGLFTLGVDLLDIDNSVQFSAPVGTVNGTDPAGFAQQLNNAISGGRRLIVAQQALGPGAAEQGVFYGVGTLVNGSPDYAGALSGTNRIGPYINSLTGVQNIPWATTDPVWSEGVSLASGTFSAGDAPRFGSSANFPSGSIFTSLGTSTTLGSITNLVAFTTQVRTNLAFGVATGDYNDDGVVDAADYTVWRDSLGDSVTALTGADGSGNGLVDVDDYNVWKNHYGSMAPALAVAIPEPSGLLLGLGAALLLPGRRRR